MFNELLNYEDGNLYWAVPKRGIKSGSRAGTTNSSGYRQVQVNGKLLAEHRVIYEMFNGQIPDGMEIDHINGIRDDNRIENLRAVTHSENQQNQKSVKGFSFHKLSGKFMAYIKLDGKRIHLGLHETPVDARAAYLRAKRKYHVSTPREYYL